DRSATPAILREARTITRQQEERRVRGTPALGANEVIARLLAAPKQAEERTAPRTYEGAHGRTAITVQSSNRQGVTLRLHAGSGVDTRRLLEIIHDALMDLEESGLGLQR
ncbi:MAG: chromosome partitioning protein ParB, partial [Novosphingobium sp.]